MSCACDEEGPFFCQRILGIERCFGVVVDRCGGGGYASIVMGVSSRCGHEDATVW